MVGGVVKKSSDILISRRGGFDWEAENELSAGSIVLSIARA